MANTTETAKASEAIVQEMRSQRQHVRVQLPISVMIRGKHCEAIDWSHHGLAFNATPLKAAHILLKHGDIFEATLAVDFQNFGLTVPLHCEVRHVNADGSRVGCKFTRMDERSISLLQYLLKAHITGQLVQVGDILDVVADKKKLTIKKEPLNYVENDVKTNNLSHVLYVAIICGLLAYILLKING